MPIKSIVLLESILQLRYHKCPDREFHQISPETLRHHVVSHTLKDLQELLSDLRGCHGSLVFHGYEKGKCIECVVGYMNARFTYGSTFVSQSPSIEVNDLTGMLTYTEFIRTEVNENGKSFARKRKAMLNEILQRKK